MSTDPPTRRELIADLTRESIDMGTYDMPAPTAIPAEALDAVARKIMDLERIAAFNEIEEAFYTSKDCPGQTFDPPCGSCGGCERMRWENAAWQRFADYREMARSFVDAIWPFGAAVDLERRVRELTISTDGDPIDPDAEIPVGEITRVLAEWAARATKEGTDRG